MSETKNGRQRPTLMGRLGRLILMVVVGVLLVGGGVFLGQKLVEGTQTQFWELDNIAKHARDVNHDQEEEIAALQAELADMMQSRDEQMEELVALTTASNTVDEQLSDLQTQLDDMAGLADDINRQAELLAGLETQLTTNTTNNADMLAALTSLETDLGATIEQVGNTATRLDNVDSELEALVDNIDAVSVATSQQITAAVTTLQAERRAQTDPAVLAQAIHTLRYFHAWELIARVRIHLAENNADLAIADLTTASSMLDELMATDAGNVEALAAIQTHVDTAANNLPDAPPVAARELNTAWTMLDELVVTSLDELEVAQMAAMGGGDEETGSEPETTMPLTSTVPSETDVVLIELAGDIADRDAEISGMAWYGDYLIFMPQYPDFAADEGDGFVFAVAKEDILAYLAGESEVLDPTQVPFDAGNVPDTIPSFEGFEAITFHEDTAYLTIEASADNEMQAYIVAGNMEPDLTAFTLNLATLTRIDTQATWANMSDETIIQVNDTLYTIYEANGMDLNENPVAHGFDLELTTTDSVAFPHIEYRITDATAVDEDGIFWAINYLFPGEGFLIPEVDPLGVQYGVGASHSQSDGVERLVAFQYTDERIVLTDMPPIQLTLQDDGELRNWEGIVRLDDQGLLIATDKFPTTLLGFVPFPDMTEADVEEIMDNEATSTDEADSANTTEADADTTADTATDSGEDAGNTDTNAENTDAVNTDTTTTDETRDNADTTNEENTGDNSSDAGNNDLVSFNVTGAAMVNTSIGVNLHVRVAPDMEADVITKLPARTIVALLEESSIGSEGRLWVRISLETIVGWVDSQYLLFLEDSAETHVYAGIA